MNEVDACVVITGEILGQRPMSQKRRDLQIIAHQSELDGRLLRPLCARRLPPTIPERQGLIDRQKLYDFHGRGRGALIELAHTLGIRQIPQPSVGCALTGIAANMPTTIAATAKATTPAVKRPVGSTLLTGLRCAYA